jgi:hypothetical protein
MTRQRVTANKIEWLEVQRSKDEKAENANENVCIVRPADIDWILPNFDERRRGQASY